MYVCGTVSIAQYCGIYSPLTSADAFMAMVRRKEGKETSVGQRERKNDGSNGDITKLRKILLDSCITISFKRIIRKQFHIKLLVILHLSIIWTENNYLGSVIFHPCSSFHVTLFGRCTCKEVRWQCGSGGVCVRVCRSSHEISPWTRQTNWFLVQNLLHL